MRALRCWTNLGLGEIEVSTLPHQHVCGPTVRHNCESNVAQGLKPHCFDQCHELSVMEVATKAPESQG